MIINNSNNFFEINDEGILFWGFDIPPRFFSLTKKIKKIIKKFKLPNHEVIEIYDDDTTEFFFEIFFSIQLRDTSDAQFASMCYHKTMPSIKQPDKSSNFFDTQLKSYVEFERRWSDILALFLTKAFGSIWFLNANLVFILVWIIVNLGCIPGVHPFDPYPFPLLLMIAAFSPMLLAIIVLINQNRQGKDGGYTPEDRF